MVDKNSTDSSVYLLFSNYATSADASQACVLLQDWIRAHWSDDRPPVVICKKDMKYSVYFAVFVANVPVGVTCQDVADTFSRFGPLVQGREVHAMDKDAAFFVNFTSFHSAMRSITAAQNREISLDGALLIVKPARNTFYVRHLLESFSGHFSLSEAVVAAASMRNLAPQGANVRMLLQSMPERFFFDNGSFHILQELEQPPPPTQHALCIPRTVSSEELVHMKRRKDELGHLIDDNCDLLIDVFRLTWLCVKGKEWIDSDSSSLSVLQQELFSSVESDTMVAPVDDWDLSTITLALGASSIKEWLSKQTIAPSARCIELNEDKCVYERYGFLVSEGHVSPRALDKYALTFSSVHCSAVQAVQSIRLVRNLMSHLKCGVNGLSAASYEGLVSVTTQAFRTIAHVLGPQHEDRFALRAAKHKDSDTDTESLASNNSTEYSMHAAVEEWLSSIFLPQYAARITEYGYDSMHALRSASEEDILEMTRAPEIDMKKPHRVLFLAEWRRMLAAC